MYKTLNAIFILNLFLFINYTFEESSPNERLLLVISLDGFRYDYLDLYANKNGFLYKIANQGVRACWSESIFPTQTYPNHWSIATGLYPEINGIINNDVYDPVKSKYFKYDLDREDQPGWFEIFEPIWITNKNSNLKRKHSVIIDWPGSSAKFDKSENKNKYTFRHPSSEFYNISSFNQTIDLFVESLSFQDTNLAFLYFGEPDMTGHLHGPESIEVQMIVNELDYVLAYLFEQMKVRKKFVLNNQDTDEMSNSFRKIDLVILTDHGMASIQDLHNATTNEKKFDENRHIYLSDYINVEKYIDIGKSSGGSFVELWLKSSNNELINELYEQVEKLKELDNKIENIYFKKNIPERFHLREHHRMAPILITAKEGFQIYITRDKKAKKYFGNHGYDHELKSMRGIFLAHGDSFKNSFYSKKPIKIIDTYLLLCNILGLTPNVNNGSFTRIKHILDENLLININSNKKFDYEIDLEEDDLIRIFMYGGVLFVVGLLFLSVIVPIITILTSVKATCHVSNTNLVKKNKNISNADRKND